MKRCVALAVFALTGAVWAELPAVKAIPGMADPDSWWMKRHRERMEYAAANGPYDVVLIGDSITEYWQTRQPLSWDRWFGTGIKALNLGFAGDHTEHVLWRIANGELDGYKTKAVVLMLGVNNPNTSLRNEVVGDVVVGIRSVLDVVRVKQPQARILLCAILPGETERTNVRPDCEAINREIRKFCDNKRIIWCDFSQAFVTSDGRLARRFLPDGLHPNSEGYDIFASAIVPYLQLFQMPGGCRPPFPQTLPTVCPDREWSVLPFEAQPYSGVNARSTRLDKGAFEDYWWLNRFTTHRERIADGKLRKVDVVMMGDSIMHFWEVFHGESWQKFTANRSVLNLGYAGDQTQNLIWRAQYGELDGYETKAVVLMIGTNNSTQRSKPEDTAAGIRRAIEVIRQKQPKAKIVLHPIFPRGNDTPSSRANHEWERGQNEKVNAIVRKFADGKDVVWVDFNAKWLPSGWGVPKELMPDGIHPSDAGYDIWMKELNPVLERIYK